ncbi:unnamed protein product, partial [Pleuronectes platessa]
LSHKPFIITGRGRRRSSGQRFPSVIYSRANERMTNAQCQRRNEPVAPHAALAPGTLGGPGASRGVLTLKTVTLNSEQQTRALGISQPMLPPEGEIFRISGSQRIQSTETSSGCEKDDIVCKGSKVKPLWDNHLGHDLTNAKAKLCACLRHKGSRSLCGGVTIFHLLLAAYPAGRSHIGDGQTDKRHRRHGGNEPIEKDPPGLFRDSQLIVNSPAHRLTTVLHSHLSYCFQHTAAFREKALNALGELPVDQLKLRAVICIPVLNRSVSARRVRPQSDVLVLIRRIPRVHGVGSRNPD